MLLSELALHQPAKFDDICGQFQELFPAPDLVAASQDYRWPESATSEQTLRKRTETAASFASWSNQGLSSAEATEHLRNVHKWGFGGQDLNRRQRYIYDKPYIDDLLTMLAAWRDRTDRDEMRSTLVHVLTFPYIGIARVSKWICFLDQQSYAIYDSRVSLALRKIEIEGRRIFPTLGAKSAGRPYQDYVGASPEIRARKITEVYCLFCDVLSAVKNDCEFEEVADVEIALFMLGVKKQYW
ncbi:hypothetical protein GV827_21290 [Sulfitobacter sp. JBTF-M27]|uniref:Uncharacterized protein n=1 Tax=Sulfitobacter sediminilitoris TaxID=2698830 RepID=A0A6P0CFH3_9RHOB|nr:hypothetical protein [Sulfitobacter sediminilitoris]NEK24909.1 hypothetical protein [Sulfitobacter sediminilitoris]